MDRSTIELVALRALHKAGHRDPRRNKQLVRDILTPAIDRLFEEAGLQGGRRASPEERTPSAPSAESATNIHREYGAPAPAGWTLCMQPPGRLTEADVVVPLSEQRRVTCPKCLHSLAVQRRFSTRRGVAKVPDLDGVG